MVEDKPLDGFIHFNDGDCDPMILPGTKLLQTLPEGSGIIIFFNPIYVESGFQVVLIMGAHLDFKKGQEMSPTRRGNP